MIFEILTELNESNSRLHKEAVFEKYKTNELFKRVCSMTYDPRLSFYIKKIPFDHEQCGKTDDISNLATALDLLTDLADRKYTGNAAIEMVKNLAESLCPEDAYVFAKVIERDLSVGCSEKTINKTWKNLIPEYPVMLALPDKEKNRASIKFPAFAQIKMDGTRINAHVTKDSVFYFTRNGKPVSLNNENLDRELFDIREVYGVDCVIDGEALCVKSDGSYYDRKTGNGWINRAIKKPESLTEEQIESFAVVVWDIIPIDAFKAEQYDVQYYDRFNQMMDLIDDDYNRVFLVDTRIVINWNEAEAFYTDALNDGQEGLIIKNQNLKWENKRPKGCVKMKAELDADLLVVGVQEGTGKYAGMVGSLICESGGADKIIVNVGSGLTDDERKRDDYVGKIVSIKYNEIINSKTSKARSLFLPIFKEVRYDKTEPDVM